MRTPLFTNDEASEPGYRNVRDAKDGPLYAARVHCEYFWFLFQRYADSEFRVELRSNFNARYWEMYLTTSFILAGCDVTCPKPGPDVGIIHKGKRIWFEAVSPNPASRILRITFQNLPRAKFTTYQMKRLFFGTSTAFQRNTSASTQNGAPPTEKHKSHLRRSQQACFRTNNTKD